MRSHLFLWGESIWNCCTEMPEDLTSLWRYKESSFHCYLLICSSSFWSCFIALLPTPPALPTNTTATPRLTRVQQVRWSVLRAAAAEAWFPSHTCPMREKRNCHLQVCSLLGQKALLQTHPLSCMTSIGDKQRKAEREKYSMLPKRLFFPAQTVSKEKTTITALQMGRDRWGYCF